MESNMNEIKENSKWIHCPIYGGKTWNKVYAGAEMFKFLMYRPKCKMEPPIIDVMQLKLAVSNIERKSEPALQCLMAQGAGYYLLEQFKKS